MDVKFIYDFVGDNFFGKIYRPIAKVSFQAPKLMFWIETWMVVDTGADFSILPQFLTDDLGLSLEKDCIKDTTAGVGGEQNIFLCKERIQAKIGNLARNVPIAFFDSNEVPPIFGRLGFLETFDVTFFKSHSVVFRD